MRERLKARSSLFRNLCHILIIRPSLIDEVTEEVDVGRGGLWDLREDYWLLRFKDIEITCIVIGNCLSKHSLGVLT